MQCSVTVVVEIDPEAGIGQGEQAVVDAGRQAMRETLHQAVRQYEAEHLACPRCGHPLSQPQGTVRRRVLTCFGRVVLHPRRHRCGQCGRRFRPAQGCLRALGRGTVTPALGAACALAGASWPYATAARVLHELCGAQVSHEEVRHWTNRLGTQQAQTQQAEAETLLAPSAEQVRAERDHAARAQRLGAEGPIRPAPDRLTVGRDGMGAGCRAATSRAGWKARWGWSQRESKRSARRDATASPHAATWPPLGPASRWEP